MLFFLAYSAFGNLIIIFALLLLFLLPFILIGVVVFILRRNNKNRTVWGNIAKNLNFTMPNPKKLEMLGRFNNCNIRLAIGARRSGGGEYNRTEFYTYCVSEFSHSLRFLLNISSPKGLLSDVFGSNSIKLNQPNFDQRFNAKCYDANVLQSLLLSNFPSDKTQNLMGDLMLANQQIGIVNITDKQVYVEKSGQIGDENVLRNMIETTANLANRFQKARETFPLADWEKQLLQHWQNLADKNNLVFNTKNFHLRGTYKNFPLFVDLKTDKDKWQTSIKLNFPNSLMVGLKLMPENSIHKALSWVGLQDIEVGIKEFDDAFIVKAQNVQTAKHKLKPEVCKQLVALNQNASALLVDDETIAFTYDTILGDEKTLKSYIEGMFSTANMLLR